MTSQLCPPQILVIAAFLLAGCASSSPPGEAGSSIKVMSYNIRYGDAALTAGTSRKDSLVVSLRYHRPDVIGVQEANEPWMAFLPGELPEYAFAGVGRDDGDTAGEFSAIFYLKDRFELIDSGTFWLSETPDRPSYGWGAGHRRICTWAYLKDRVTGRVTAFFNTHLDHQVHEARVNGVDLILTRIARTPHPVVLTGDLNVNEGSELYKAVSASSLADTKHLAAESRPHGTFNGFDPEDATRVIDYVFVEEERFQVLRYQVDHLWRFEQKPVSDHYPVIAEVVLR